MDENKREKFEEFVPEVIIDLFPSGEAGVENTRFDDIKIKTKETVRQEIKPYLISDELFSKCIKKIHGL